MQNCTNQKPTLPPSLEHRANFSTDGAIVNPKEDFRCRPYPLFCIALVFVFHLVVRASLLPPLGILNEVSRDTLSSGPFPSMWHHPLHSSSKAAVWHRCLSCFRLQASTLRNRWNYYRQLDGEKGTQTILSYGSLVSLFCCLQRAAND